MSSLVIPKQDLKKIVKIFSRKIGILLIFIWALYFDGTHFASIFPYAQWFTNFFMLVAFIALYKRSVKRVRELILYAVILGFLGEYLFSIVLDMYTYRLSNLPFYIPLGHAALYARVLTFTKSSIAQKYSNILSAYLGGIIIIIALVYLYFFNDVFGFVMTIGVFLLLWKRPKDRLFFFTMYLSVVLLELSGTYYSVWSWPSTAFGVFDFLPSHNPPSGISLFYFLLDIGCFVIYTQVHRIAWRRVKNIRKLRTNG